MTQADSVHSTPPSNTSATPAQVAAVAPADTEEKSNHYGNPEEQICDLFRAADLAAFITDDWLTEGRTAPGSGSLYIYLPEDFAERLIFVADEVRTRVRALKEFYYDGGFDYLARSRAKRPE
jgi:hypothetical protein